MELLKQSYHAEFRLTGFRFTGMILVMKGFIVMNRTKKNIILIVIAVLLAGCMVFTAHSAGASLNSFPDMPQMMQGGPGGSNGYDNAGAPDASQNQDGDDQDSSGDSNADQNNGSSDADQNSNDSNADQSNKQNDSNNDAAGNNENGSADQKSDSSKGTPPTPPSGDFDGKFDGNPPNFGSKSISDISAVYFILFGAEGLAFALVLLYLIMSGMNRRTMAETFSNKKRIAAFVIAALLIGGGLTAGQAALATTAFASSGPSFDQQLPGGPGSSDQQSSVEATGATTVDGTEETLNETYASTNADENVILVTNGGTLTSEGATINKESGDSSNTESSDFSGVNAGLLVQENSTATVKGATIKTSAKGANAVFATGENAKVTISDSTITTTGEGSSRGLDATYGGTIEADNVTITTQGRSCAAMATDRGEGTVSATNSTLETNGAGSPVIYSTGNISLTDSEGTANGSQITVVEGKNSATIENSELTASGAGNRGDVDIAGVMVYQSMSGDAAEGTGNFTAKESRLSISKDSNYYKTAPMFFVTNTDAVIDLTNTELNFGSGVLLSAQGTSEWGKEGSNGGNVTFNASKEKLTGNIQLDEISTLTMNLTGSTYKGTINGDNTAKSVTLSLDKDSKITLTGDSYVTSLEDADSSYSNIDFNGYKLYVNGEAIN